MSLLGVKAAVQNTTHKAVLRGQGGRAGQQDASLQSLTVTWVWQGHPFYLHNFTSMPLSVHTLCRACTALSADCRQAWVAVMKVDGLTAAIAAAVVLVFPPPMMPQV